MRDHRLRTGLLASAAALSLAFAPVATAKPKRQQQPTTTQTTSGGTAGGAAGRNVSAQTSGTA